MFQVVDLVEGMGSNRSDLISDEYSLMSMVGRLLRNPSRFPPSGIYGLPDPLP